MTKAHQPKGILEKSVGVINLDKNAYISSAGFSRYLSVGEPTDDDARDLCVFEFTEQVLQNLNLQRHFFTLSDGKLLRDRDEVLGYLAYGSPFVDQNYDLHENNHFGTVRPNAAGRVVTRLVAAVDKLAELPAPGRIGRITGTRELVLSDIPHIIPYRLRHDIEILTVMHASQKWPKKL